MCLQDSPTDNDNRQTAMGLAAVMKMQPIVADAREKQTEGIKKEIANFMTENDRICDTETRLQLMIMDAIVDNAIAALKMTVWLHTGDKKMTQESVAMTTEVRIAGARLQSMKQLLPTAFTQYAETDRHIFEAFTICGADDIEVDQNYIKVYNIIICIYYIITL